MVVTLDFKGRAEEDKRDSVRKVSPEQNLDIRYEVVEVLILKLLRSIGH
jgi:hypothetical protein